MSYRVVKSLGTVFSSSIYQGNYSFNRPSDNCQYIQFMKQLYFGPRRTAEALLDAGLIKQEKQWTKYRHYCNMVSTLKKAGLITFEDKKCQLTGDGFSYLQIAEIENKITLPQLKFVGADECKDDEVAEEVKEEVVKNVSVVDLKSIYKSLAADTRYEINTLKDFVSISNDKMVAGAIVDIVGNKSECNIQIQHMGFYICSLYFENGVLVDYEMNNPITKKHYNVTKPNISVTDLLDEIGEIQTNIDEIAEIMKSRYNRYRFSLNWVE